MIGKMNETRVWYCDICGKTINIKSKPKHNFSKTHKHKEKYGTVVKDYNFIDPDIDEVNYILNDNIKDCRKKYFLSFEYRCVYDIEVKKFTNNEEVILTITHGYMELKFQFYGLSENFKNARHNAFIFNEIVILTIKIESTLSSINMCSYLKLRIPIIHRHFLK